MTRPTEPPPLNLRLGRRRIQVAPVLGMIVAWVLLFGELSVGTVLSGLCVGVVVMVVFPMPLLDTGLRLHPWPAAVFLVRFGYDLVTAAMRVAALAFAFGRTPRSSVIAVPLRTESDLLLTATAIVVSVIPGSVIVEVGYASSTLFVHALGAQDADAAQAAREDVLRLEERITRAFGTRADIRLLEESARTGGAA
ncbi:multicomponent Na+:H+ antiporter subunit E [Spinactinospora alkalitolerans]|uniref:Multicomponent Na+:H+ antiporter subunit E n=1 Tax=Spinactinospora alkalitolerans TaxID=687207 RepID=A0A852TR67_9ACTN|nr:Na+/H+ antiporter subunit E [Spinactinospora alkalitolerans]NYE45322.1 multicomponent Na+:H+ antiporter subunit E [Spinactinospora alkalitolerans]